MNDGGDNLATLWGRQGKTDEKLEGTSAQGKTCKW